MKNNNNIDAMQHDRQRNNIFKKFYGKTATTIRIQMLQTNANHTKTPQITFIPREIKLRQHHSQATVNVILSDGASPTR